jgi:hypothetical protein
MMQTDVTCLNCFAGYRRIQLYSRAGRPGEYRCLVCDQLLEVFDGSVEVAYRSRYTPCQPMVAPRTINID